jgi:hypothetical protein
VTGEEANLGAVRQEMLDFDHVRLRALGAVHIDSLLLGVATCYDRPRLTTTSPPLVDALHSDCVVFRLRSSMRTNRDRAGMSCSPPFHNEPPACGVAPGDDRPQ